MVNSVFHVPQIVEQTRFNPPYTDWENISNLIYPDLNGVDVNREQVNKDTYAKTHISSSVKYTYTPSSLKLSGFGFNIPHGSTIDSLSLFMDTHSSHESGTGGEVNVSISKIIWYWGDGNKYTDSDVPDINNLFTDYTNLKEVGDNDYTTWITYDKSALKIPSTVDVNSNDFAVEIIFDSNKSDIGGWLYIDFLAVRLNYTPSVAGIIGTGNSINDEQSVVITNDAPFVPNYQDPRKLPYLVQMVSNGEVTSGFPSRNNPKIIVNGDTFVYNVFYSAYGGQSNVSQDTTVKVKVNIPDGLEIVDFNTTGAFNKESRTWYPQPVRNQVTQLSLTLKGLEMGYKELYATLEGVRTTLTYWVFVNPKWATEGVVFNSPGIYLGDRDNYPVISIKGESTNSIYHDWEISSSEADLLMDGQSNNPYIWGDDYRSGTVLWNKTESENIKDITYTNKDFKTDVITIEVLDVTKPYHAVIMPQYSPRYDPNHDNSGNYDNTDTYLSLDSNKKYTVNVHVHEGRIYEFQGVGQHFIKSSDKFQAVYADNDDDIKVTTVIGAGQHFIASPPDLSLTIEEAVPYIGCVTLDRAHMKPQNDFTNTLLDNRWKDRRNMGKKGDIEDKTTLQIRVHPEDIVTLRGLAAMDKPTPIDLIPDWWEGDPLNHRGWGVMHNIKNVKKINDMRYQIDIDVQYLSHNIKTYFSIIREERVCEKTVPYTVMPMHDETERLDDYMTITADSNGNYAPEKITPVNSQIPYYKHYIRTGGGESMIFRTNDALGNKTNILFEWLNYLQSHSNYEHELWQMYIRLYAPSTITNNNVVSMGEPNLVFEYLYHSFRHMDETTDEILNQCDVKARYLDNNAWKVLNYANMNLNWNNIPAEDITEKENTKLSIIADETDKSGNITIYINSEGEELKAKLTTEDDVPLVDKTVNFTLKNTNNGLEKTYYIKTGQDGYARLPIHLAPNGRDDAGNYLYPYTGIITYEGSSTYNGVSQKISRIIVDYTDATETYIQLETIGQNGTITHLGEMIKAHLYYDTKTVNEKGETVTVTKTLANKSLIFTAVPRDSSKKTLKVVRETDSNGVARASFWGAGGIYDLTVEFVPEYSGGMGYAGCTNNTTFTVNLGMEYNTAKECYFDTTSTVKFFKTTANEIGVYLYARSTGSPVVGANVEFTLHNLKTSEFKTYYCDTNSLGYAKVPINLNNGLYRAYIHYEGKYNGKEHVYVPVCTDFDFSVKANGKNNAQFKGSDSFNITKKGQNYNVQLVDLDNDNKPIANKWVRLLFRVYDDLENLSRRVGYDILTDENGNINRPIELANGQYRVDVVFPRPQSVSSTYAKDIDFNLLGSPTTNGLDLEYNDCVFTSIIGVNRDETSQVGDITTQISFSTEDNAQFYGDDKISGKLVSSKNTSEGLADKEIDITVSGTQGTKTYTVRTGKTKSDDLGIFSLPITLGNGTYNYTVAFKGDETYAPCTTGVRSFKMTRTNTGTPTGSSTSGTGNAGNNNGANYVSTAMSKNDVRITSPNYDWSVRLTDANGKVITGEEVTLTFKQGEKSKEYKVTTDNLGKAHKTIQLGNGDYTIEATFVGNNFLKGSSSTSSITVDVTRKPTKLEILSNSTQVKGNASVKWRLTQNGVPLKTMNGNTYTVCIQGRVKGTSTYGNKYYIDTDQNGEVELDVNYSANTYTFTAVYEGSYDLNLAQCSDDFDLTVVNSP